MTPLQEYGLWAMGGTLASLFAFLGLRGRVAIERGWGGMTIPRFTPFERACHWLLAGSFMVLALTGLNALYGRQLVLPVVGEPVFTALAQPGRVLHSSVAFAFMAALILTFFIRLAHSFPGWRDAVWLAKAGGMFVKGSTPPAGKFNAAQKILFWLVLLGGLGLAATGIALLLPYRTGMVSKTFAVLAAMGFQLPTGISNLTPLQEVHYARLWHGALAIGLICVIMVHVYLRTLGIQGAFSAMATGEIDVNLARQQHSLWAERELKRMQDELPAARAPAE